MLVKNEKERKTKEQGKAIVLEGEGGRRNRKRRKRLLPDLKHPGSRNYIKEEILLT